MDAHTIVQSVLPAMREAQRSWSRQPVRDRLRAVRVLRHDVALDPNSFAEVAMRPGAGDADGAAQRLAEMLSSEVLPLLEACRYLEREAEFLLAPRTEPNRLRPFWLGGVTVETRRDPLGVVLIIGPGNYPLFLPGAQALQALVAGNAVLWKPAPGGRAAAQAMRRMLVSNGLDPQLLTVLDESAESAVEAIHRGVDKVILTGSAETGRSVMRELAENLTPAVMELSGCDAVFVQPGAELDRVAEALAFGLRLNGSATCMAPRRVFVPAELQERLLPVLTRLLRQLKPVEVSQKTRTLLGDLTAEATMFGAKLALNGLDAPVSGAGAASLVGATLVTDAQPSMRIVRSDIFAPVLSLIAVEDDEQALRMHGECPYALTAAIFGPEKTARALAGRVHAGVVLVNDVIVSTADPRASFGGRGMSGFGSTRGAEGLLAMTAVKTVIVKRSRERRSYQPTNFRHSELFSAYIRLAHGSGWKSRFRALRDLVRAASEIK